MADAFRNYENLLNSLDNARNEAANTNITYHQTKAGVDNTAKILGETKMFLSGKPALKKFGDNYVKPLYKKYGKEFVDNKVASIKDKLGFKQTPKPESSPDAENANEAGSSTKEPVSEEPEVAEPEEVIDSAGREAGLNAADDARTEEVNNIVARGAKRADMFESKVASGDAEGEQLIKPIRDMDNPFANNLEDYRNSNLTDFAEPRTTFTAEDLGAKGVDQVYERGSGLTADEANTLTRYSNEGINPANLRGATSVERTGTFDNAVAESKTVSDVGTSTASEVEGAAADAAKQAAGGAAKVAAEEGGEEAATGILDAIPGLDVFGVIGGAIITAIMEHKEKKEEEAEKGVTAASGVDSQIGVTSQEALS